MFCPKCGMQNDDNAFKCMSCDQILHPIQQTTIIKTSDSALGGLIPYKNSYALIAYYLGIFSIIPLFGIFLGITAFILGLKGLQFAKKNPEAKGKAHAWVGILVGGFFGFGYLVAILILVI